MTKNNIDKTKVKAIKEMEIKIKSRDTSWETRKLTSSSEAAELCRLFYEDDLELFESFFMLMLNQRGKVIAYVKISQGGIAGTVVDVTIIAKYAIDSLARRIILCHNHPSGNLQPSEADKRITEMALKGLKFFDIDVTDHIILTKDSYFSFKDEGLL